MDIDEVLTRGVEKILPSKESLKNLMEAKKITLYQGFDPSSDSLHLGNLVGIMKLAQFQKLGHKIIFLVGDFTGMIGDPTDKLAVRKKLTRDEVLKNSSLWKDQINNILNFEGENAAELKYNSEWSDKINFKDLIDITSNLTVQQLIERDMFQKRLKDGKPIYLHEFLYPVAQGYDSAEMGVDLEIGGTDQIFNMLIGRSLSKALKNIDKYVLGTKLLVDDNGEKIGKTTGNALFLSSGPEKFYGGVMSFPDEGIYLTYELLTNIDLKGLEQAIKKDPMGQKKALAWEIVKNIWGNEKADLAQESFEKTFQDNTPVFDQMVNALENLASTIAPYTSLKSTTDAKRLISQQAVDVNGETITNPGHKLKSGDEVKVGEKVFLKIK
ncbi:MAG TPA: tyrosine--tRNA ligase [Patescibacteria group bacterium]|nr:tyrosine--tRNA ligase [Patescibacteria group bacterium]